MERVHTTSPSTAHSPITRILTISSNVAHSGIIKPLTLKLLAIHMLDAPETTCRDRG
jgi:hypothetical protein